MGSSQLHVSLPLLTRACDGVAVKVEKEVLEDVFRAAELGKGTV